MPAQRNILFFSHDQGGLQTVVPVAEALSAREDVRAIKVTSRVSAERNRETNWNRIYEEFNSESFRQLHDLWSPELVVTGTSYSGVMNHLNNIICRIG